MKRPACLQRQTGACRSCGLAVSQPCRGHEEPVETTDALRPTGGGRGAGCTLSFVSNGESDRLPTAVPVPSDGSDQLQSLNGCPTGEGLITPTAGLDRGRRTSVNSVVSARAACEGPTSTPLRQQFPRGRPGESESSSGHARATGTTHPGFYGRKPWRKPNSAVIIARPGASMRGPAGPLPHIAAKVFTKVDSDSPPSEPATSARATG